MKEKDQYVDSLQQERLDNLVHLASNGRGVEAVAALVSVLRYSHSVTADRVVSEIAAHNQIVAMAIAVEERSAASYARCVELARNVLAAIPCDRSEVVSVASEMMSHRVRLLRFPLGVHLIPSAAQAMADAWEDTACPA